MERRYDNDDREWLEADGLGGFSSGTVSGERTRRYHALLLAATTPPTGRMTLVNGFDAFVQAANGREALSSQRYAPDVRHPDGASRIVSFEHEPWPAWTFALDAGVTIRQEIVVPHGRAAVLVSWQLVTAPPGGPVHLRVRPFLSGRDYHSLVHENGACNTRADVRRDCVRWQLYDGVPAVVSCANAAYEHEPVWYRQFLYTAERDRGLDDREDLLAPGWLTFDLRAGVAHWLIAAGMPGGEREDEDVRDAAERIREGERARRGLFASPLHRAADAYLVARGARRTIIAGYPWFTDWGRDTFISLRGLCLATGRFEQARDVLLEWTDAESDGMVPNRFPDAGRSPEFNAVDASLWYVLAVRDLCAAADSGAAHLPGKERERLVRGACRILEGYTAGTRFGIRLDADGLLACGATGVALTWMDAKVGDWVVTPRIGKPVEVQALWLAALDFGARREGRWQTQYVRSRLAFLERFWDPERQYLYDVVDVDHVTGTVDPTLRPNQVLAVGGLGGPVLDAVRSRRVIDVIEQHLLTPCGLRTLAPGDPAYAAHYRGGPGQRDAAYHQGTAWPWLMGPFIEAWLTSRGNTDAACREARRRFLPPLRAHLHEAGLGHVSEVTDAEAPFTPGGCPFQAWSVGELLRIVEMLSAADPLTGAALR